MDSCWHASLPELGVPPKSIQEANNREQYVLEEPHISVAPRSPPPRGEVLRPLAPWPGGAQGWAPAPVGYRARRGRPFREATLSVWSWSSEAETVQRQTKERN